MKINKLRAEAAHQKSERVGSSGLEVSVELLECESDGLRKERARSAQTFVQRTHQLIARDDFLMNNKSTIH